MIMHLAESLPETAEKRKHPTAFPHRAQRRTSTLTGLVPATNSPTTIKTCNIETTIQSVPTIKMRALINEPIDKL